MKKNMNTENTQHYVDLIVSNVLGYYAKKHKLYTKHKIRRHM